MPRLPDADHIIRIKLAGQLSSNPWATIQYARFTGSQPDSAALATTANALKSTAFQAIIPMMGTANELLTIECTDLTNETGASGISSATPVLGTRAGTVNPNQVCAVASYKIARRYRGGHPRTYWPIGVQSDITAGSRWTTAFVPLPLNAVTAWVGNVNATNLNGAPLQHGCLSYYTRDPNNPGHSMLRPVPQFFPTQSVEFHGRVDTQRRRLGKEFG